MTTRFQNSDYAATLLRVSMGLMFLAHAIVLKVMTFTVPGTVQYFQTIGFPGFFAYLVIFGEIAGGVALLAGVFTRTAALALIPIMIGALLQHTGNGWVFSAQGGGWEFPALWTVLLVIQALLGEGAYALGPVLRQVLTGTGKGLARA